MGAYGFGYESKLSIAEAHFGVFVVAEEAQVTGMVQIAESLIPSSAHAFQGVEAFLITIVEPQCSVCVGVKVIHVFSHNLVPPILAADHIVAHQQYDVPSPFVYIQVSIAGGNFGFVVSLHNCQGNLGSWDVSYYLVGHVGIIGVTIDENGYLGWVVDPVEPSG